MKIKDLYNYINSFAPFGSQCEWDNSGLILGDMNKDINKAGFALDITEESADDAVANNCDIIITHHPLIFRPVGSIGSDSLIYQLIKNDISVISAHTNLDKSPVGVNFVLAEKAGLKKARSFSSDTDASMCFIGETDEMKAEDFAQLLSVNLNTHIEFTCPGKIIRKAAVCGGSGGDFLYETAPYIDAFVTGEVKHHEFLDSRLKGISIFKAGHFETEYPVIPYLCRKTSEETGLECVLLKESKPCICIGDK